LLRYLVAFTWNGRTKWERAGTNERQARALEAQRKREVEAGTYSPDSKSGRVTVRTWLDEYLSKRTNRTVDNDRALVENHVLSVDSFASMRLQDVRPRDMLRLVEGMKRSGRLGEKSVATVYGIV
jgi:hypothetical protein